MPYASNKQAAWMHINRPDIAAKWHEEGHGYVKGGKNDPAKKKKRRVRKSGSHPSGWLKPLAIGTAGGALANQLPSFEEQRRLRENRRRRKAARIKKMDAPVWPDDGFFNAEAAQEAYDLVMKMDRDEAEMFVTCVVSDALETDIAANRRTLQAHLDEVVAKRLTDLKRATLRVVAKGGDADEQVAFAQALALIEKADDDDNPWDPKLHPRGGVNPGWFRSTVKHTQKKPLHEKTAKGLGIPKHPHDNGRDDDATGAKFTPEQRAQYQDEYRQLKSFLDTAYASSRNPGDTKVQLHFKDDHGNRWVENHDSTRAKPKVLDPRDRTLVGMSAQPDALTVGGTAFGLGSALGGQMPAGAVRGINRAGSNKGFPAFAESWTQDYGEQDTNARLYGRTAAAGALLAHVAPEGSKANLAGHFGQFVGQYGPQAEAVIGPPARRTAYRYRGTEKKPDQAMVDEYEKTVRTAMGRRGFTEQDEKARRRAEAAAIRAKTMSLVSEDRPYKSIRLTQEQRAEAMNNARRTVINTSAKPTWEEQNAGAAEIANYLGRPVSEGGAAPNRGLYNLQLASGNTPPSEGVILDRDGRIVTQAIGYGDDHYLPFNLKNLKGLKGGQYIRNRSVGGLTSEDIYTGLVSGARRVTVVSRSGTFTMEFEPDFRGGRRHNDKAARMTRRYEQILDAVQSEQVEKEQIDPEMRRVITQRVLKEAHPAMRSADIRNEINRRIEDYKSNPDLDEEFEQYVDMIVANRTRGMTSVDAQKVRSTVRNEQAKQKEYKFRLNGAGYADALESLREQFPYYIKTESRPTMEEGRHETERDKGYVEPGRIRPTAAAAGLFGGAKGPSFADMGGKVSAAQADYARPFTRPPKKEAEPKEPGTEGTEGTTTTEGGEAKKPETGKPKTVGEVRERAKYEDAALALQQAIKTKTDLKRSDVAPWVEMEPEEFRAYLQNKENLANFDHFVTTRNDELSGAQVSGTYPLQAPLAGYRQASSRVDQKPYEAILSQHWGDKPYGFTGKAYEAGASDADRATEMSKIGADRVGVVNLKPLGQMSDNELKQEVLAVAQVRRELGGLSGDAPFEAKQEAFRGINRESPMLQAVFDSDKSMEAYLEAVHRTRAVNAGVPDAERGYKEVIHNRTETPKEAEKANQEVRDKAMVIGAHARELMQDYDEDSEEYQALQQLHSSLTNDESEELVNTPSALSGVIDANPDAVQLIQREIRSGRLKQQPQNVMIAPGSRAKTKEIGGSVREGPILT